ncbi:MAG: hypothetical protein A2283_10075 [Lentisphaerae bacterium RIFOXYA12_FULL_48_11]|nr:MAG: hypothetical protein A2283_10075 [Lentisphaerae bacterium RIFOXYA12_FULL_48_11]
MLIVFCFKGGINCLPFEGIVKPCSQEGQSNVSPTMFFREESSALHEVQLNVKSGSGSVTL